MKTKTDLELIALMGKDNKEAFGELYRRYRNMIYRYLYNKVRDEQAAEDLMQDTFISLWRYRHKTHITTCVSAFVFSAARHRMFNHIRENIARDKRIVSKGYEDMICYGTVPFYYTPDRNTNVSDIKRLIRKKLRTLPYKARLAFRMSRFRNMSIKEIAAKMKISCRTVENYITLCLKAFQEINQTYSFQ